MMYHLESIATPAAVFDKTAKTEENYDAFSSATLLVVICEIGRSFGTKKLTNVDILLFHLYFPTGNTPNINLAVKFARNEDTLSRI